MGNETQPSGHPLREAAAAAVAPDPVTAGLLAKHSAGEKLSQAEYGKLGAFKARLNRFLAARVTTKLLRPWHRLKHRVIAWMLSLLIPVLLNELLQQFSAAATPSPSGGSKPRHARLALPVKRWIVSGLRLLLRQMTSN